MTLKEYLTENRETLQKNRIKQNYQDVVDKINQFFLKQIEIIEIKREKLMADV